MPPVSGLLPLFSRWGIDWETLTEAPARGHFEAAPPITTGSKPLQLWFIRACLQASRREMVDADQLLSLPMAFPFTVTIKKPDLRRSTAFVIHRQGIDMDMIAAAGNNGSAPTSETRRRCPAPSG